MISCKAFSASLSLSNCNVLIVVCTRRHFRDLSKCELERLGSTSGTIQKYGIYIIDLTIEGRSRHPLLVTEFV
jgi:hypothetical protein